MNMHDCNSVHSVDVLTMASNFSYSAAEELFSFMVLLQH